MVQQVSNVYSDFKTSNVNAQNNTANNRNLLKTDKSTDTFVNSQKPETDKNKKWKILAGIGAGLLAVGAGAMLVFRCKFQAIKQLAPHIDFKKAKTIEEAKQFALENFKIKKFDVGDDVNMANWVNEALTKVSNNFKGRAFLPAEVRLMSKSEAGVGKFAAGASMSRALHAKEMSNVLKINPEEFTEKGIIDTLEILASKPIKSQALPFQNLDFRPFIDLKKAFDNGEKITIEHWFGRTLAENAAEWHQYNKLLSSNPMVIAKDLYSQNGFSELVKKHIPNAFKEMSELEKMKPEQVKSYLTDIWKTLSGKLKWDELPKSTVCQGQHSPFRVIFHELGHANHERNAVWKYAKMAVSYDEKNPVVGKLAKFFRESPEEQLIASTVSDYAKHSPLEFVAEVFARSMEGYKFNDDVMNLYKKYKGPALS